MTGKPEREDEDGERTRSIVDSKESSARVLVFWEGGTIDRRLPKEGALTVGRGDGCALKVDHTSVSRQHARLHVGDGLFIEDLGSSNGTQLRGSRLPPNERVPLRSGDVVEVGIALLVVHFGAPRTSGRTSQPPPEGDGMVRVLRLADLVAPSDINVLLLGETGVGKDVLAQRIHQSSRRNQGVLLRLNSAALPPHLLEGELFGYERGAFTGATQAKPGLLEAAAGGTVLLDEVADLTPSTQSKLLLVLENREVLRLGAVRPRPIDVRFLSATNHDLDDAVRAGVFRSDLLYRLSGLTIRIPPLRDRRGEIEELARVFIAEGSRKAGRAQPLLSRDVVAALEAHPWPGNVRELKSTIDRALLLCSGGALQPAHLSFDLAPRSVPPPAAPGVEARAGMSAAVGGATDVSAGGGLKDELGALERERILEVLARCGGNQSRAAAELGISRRTLLHRLDSYAVPRPRKK